MKNYDDLGFEAAAQPNNPHADLGFVPTSENQPGVDIKSRIVPPEEAEGIMSRFGKGVYQSTVGPLADIYKHHEQNVKEYSDKYGAPGALLAGFKTMYDLGKGVIKSSNDEGVKTLKALGSMDFGEAIRHLPGIIPMVGPAAVQASEQMKQGNVAGGLGQAAGLIGTAYLGEKAPAIAESIGKIPAKVGAVADKTSSALYQSALKPSLSAKNTPKIAGQIETGLREGIPVSKTGLDKLTGLVQDVRKTINDKISAGSGKTVDPQEIAKRLNASELKFGNQALPGTDVGAIQAARQQWLERFAIKDADGATIGYRQIPVEEAQKIKQGTYSVNSKKYGELSSAQMEAEKSLARGIKEELETQFPELKALNARQGSMLELRQQLERAISRTHNWEVLNPGLHSLGAGTVAGLATGSGPLGIGTVFLSGILKNPAIKSRLAIALSNASKIKTPSLGAGAAAAAASRIDGYLESLGKTSE